MFNSVDKITAQLPVLFLEQPVPLPYNEYRFGVKGSKHLLVLKAAEQYKNHMVIMIKDKEHSTDLETKYFTTAIVVQILLNMTSPNDGRKIKVKAIVRCNVQRFVDDGPVKLAEFTTMPSIMSDLDRANAARELIRQETKEGINKNNPFDLADPKELVESQMISLDELSEVLASALRISAKEKTNYLVEIDITKRLLMVLEDIHKQNYYQTLEDEIDAEVRRSINESQKEFYLREKMKAIQNELGDKAKKESDIDELREKIKNANMPKNIEEKALHELNRYTTTPTSSPESGIIRSYLDFLIALPWNTQTEDTNDIRIAKAELEKYHYGLDAVKDRILEYLAVKIATGKNPQAILCLVGPPGVGKTSLAKSLATAMGKKFVKVALGGVRDEAEIRGHRRTYIGALPGRILQAMKKAGTNNPVFLLDEIDKMSSDYKGDPTSAMLEVLDGEQNHFFSDHYLEEPFDLSNVFFVATANYLGNIPAPLRDRMEIVEISSYTEYEKYEIAKIHLLPKQLEAHGLEAEKLVLTDQAIYKIIQEYTRESGVRELERFIGTIIRKAIKNILMNQESQIKVDVDNLEEYLGKPRYTYSKVRNTDQVGVVTGLAYTQFGGDTLSVEVTHYKGQGRLVLTGKLGDVMKESAQAALSYVKSNYDKFNIDYNLFNENDIHLHVPEGAIPKDGPSAGVTITTGIISSFTNRPVDHTVGMTGEITLRGMVLPIGGLREKAIAAHRSGLQTILIPIDNVKDLEEIPDSVKNSLKIIPVSTIEEVIKYALK